MKNQADVIIIGAGPAGTSAAYHLAKEGIDVLLIDKASFPREKVCGDGLAPLAMEELEKIGLRQQTEAKGAILNGGMLFSPNGHSFTVDNYPAGNCMMKRRDLDELLRQQACAAGAVFLDQRSIIEVEKRKGKMTVQDQYMDQYFCKLVIIATGSNSALPINLGLSQLPSASAVACRAYFANLNLAAKHSLFCYAKDVLPGYGWIFPLGEGQYNIGVGVFLNQGKMPELKNIWDNFILWLEKQKFMDQNTRRISETKTACLRMGLERNRLYSEGILLAGDAASAINPLNGEGVSYALQTGRLAAMVAKTALQKNDFSGKTFRSYRRILKKQYQARFSQYRLLRRLLESEKLVDKLFAMAGTKPKLAKIFFGTLIGDIPPIRLLGQVLWQLVSQGVSKRLKREAKRV